MLFRETKSFNNFIEGSVSNRWNISILQDSFLLGDPEVSANLYCNSRTSVLWRLRDYLRLLMGNLVSFIIYKKKTVFFMLLFIPVKPTFFGRYLIWYEDNLSVTWWKDFFRSYFLHTMMNKIYSHLSKYILTSFLY